MSIVDTRVQIDCLTGSVLVDQRQTPIACQPAQERACIVRRLDYGSEIPDLPDIARAIASIQTPVATQVIVGSILTRIGHGGSHTDVPNAA